MEWKTIDSAPKDGRDILVIDVDGTMTVTHWGFRMLSGKGFWERMCDNEYERPTHWMPLPDKPLAINKPE